MKKSMTVLFILFCVSAFYVLGANTKPRENLKVVNIYNLNNNELKEIMDGLHPEMVVEFPAKTILPFKIFLDGDLVGLVDNKPMEIEVKQQIYFRYKENKLLASSDLISWKPALAFITGNITATLKNEDGRPVVILDAEVNKRS